MTTLKFLAQLKDLGMNLWVEEGSRLCFRARRGIMTPKIRQELRARKNHILDMLKEASKVMSGHRELIRPGSIHQAMMSFAQERLWKLEQREPGNPALLLCEGYRLNGRFHAEAAAKALRELIIRHETLRTCFHNGETGVEPRVITDFSFSLEKRDLSLEPRKEQDRLSRLIASEFAHRPLNLEKVPLLRACAIRLGERDHILLLRVHHLAADLWSLGILWQEWALFYNAQIIELNWEAPALPLRYQDFAHWQRRRGPEGSISYWRRKLANLEPVYLPTDHPREQTERHLARSTHFSLSRGTTEALHRLEERHNVSVFMILLAAFQVWQYHVTNRTDIAVGADIGHRNVPEIEGLVGVFVNHITLRVDLSGNPTFVQLLSRAKKVILEAITHQDVPFTRVLQACAPTSQREDANALFRTQIIYAGVPRGIPRADGLQSSQLSWLDNAQTRSDIALIINEERGALETKVEYNGALFELTTITRFASHFRVILESALMDINIPLSDIPVPRKREPLMPVPRSTEKWRGYRFALNELE